MRINRIFTAAVAFSAMFAACQEDEINPSVGETSIAKTETDFCATIPFESKSVLSSFSDDAEVIEYNLARKLALTEFIGTGMDSELGWKGCKLGEIPVVIYGFDNKPKFYDFIVYDAENNVKGTITAYAKRKSSTMIRAVTQGIKNYTGQLSKAGLTASLFMDWSGTEYVGVRGKAGDIPTAVIDAETGEQAETMTELTDEEIIEILKNELLPALTVNDNTIDFSEITDDSLLLDFDFAKNISIEDMVDSLKISLADEIENTEAFWADMQGLIDEVDSISDEDIIDESGKAWKIFRRIFSKVDRSKTYLSKYNAKSYFGTSGSIACGPWVCGYIYYVNYGQNKYDYFYNCASTVGEFGLANVAFRLMNQRAMTPAEMSWSMAAASNGKIKINPTLKFNDFAAYDQIHHYKSPALRLCSSNKSLHWMLAYGTYQSGNYFWRNYYFLMHDNHSHGEYQNPTDSKNYHQVDWWNPWLMVRD